MEHESRKPAERRAPGIGAISLLPVFIDLRGKVAIVAGDSAEAAWKAELLAAAGANVRVFAPTSDSERRIPDALVDRHHRSWIATDLVGATMAVIDTDDDAEARAFREAAHRAGAICNCIDRSADSDVQFGAIVNRSPVVIGISTDGAAPVLAQAIRRRIETLLPRTLGNWAAAAKAIRTRIAQALPAMGRRRAFWREFAERAFSGKDAPDAGDLYVVDAANDRLGQVTLVGAGPGDAELLTLKGMRALQSADVILFDDLVSDDVLELARREAKRMVVGKRGGRPSCRQDEINDLMVRLARQGKNVVRLKSGDPMIFGRAGEELAHLEAAGIAAHVVPGITTAAALAARLGASLTHRDHAQSVRLVTGHARDGACPEYLDWRGLADPRTTLVVYMAGSTASSFASRLMREGLAGNTPVVVAAGVSRRGETIWGGTLASLAARADGALSDLPIILGIGSAFGEAAARSAGYENAGELAMLARAV